jgi:hypothetical protein
MDKLGGNPREGIHSSRTLGDLAAVDVGATLLFSYGLSRYCGISFIRASIISFGSGIIAHRLFGVRTTIDKLLFDNRW